MRLCGLDIGLKRIGVALCLDGKIILPQNAILRKNRNQAAADVRRFLEEWKIEKVIVGLPKGGEHEEEMRRRIEHFMGLLELCIPIEYIDEAFSSFEAKQMSAGIFRHKRDGKIDSLSAQLILERFLDANAF